MPQRLRAPAAAALLLALAGCTAPPDPSAPRTEHTAPAASRTEPGVVLDAVLDSPVDITLRWTGAQPGIAGRVLEFATEPRGPYTVLEFMPPGRTSFRHPDLMPHTPFLYRLRPYSGPASTAVEVTLPPGEPTEKDQRNDHRWAPPRTVDGPPAVTHPVREAAAAPAGLRATVQHAAGIRFTWTDHAQDEDGFLLEARPSGSGGYLPVAVLDPDINSFGLITLPEEKRASYRVRAFAYGKASHTVRLTTGASAD